MNEVPGNQNLFNSHHDGFQPFVETGSTADPAGICNRDIASSLMALRDWTGTGFPTPPAGDGSFMGDGAVLNGAYPEHGEDAAAVLTRTANEQFPPDGVWTDSLVNAQQYMVDDFATFSGNESNQQQMLSNGFPCDFIETGVASLPGNQDNFQQAMAHVNGCGEVYGTDLYLAYPQDPNFEAPQAPVQIAAQIQQQQQQVQVQQLTQTLPVQGHDQGQGQVQTPMPQPVPAPMTPSETLNPPIKRRFSEANIAQDLEPPTKRFIKAIITVPAATNEEFELKRESERMPTGKFQGLFPSSHFTEQKRQCLLRMYRKPTEYCTYPSGDATFPKRDADKAVWVKRLFEAVNDWDDFREWPQALKPGERNRIIDQLRRSRLGEGAAPAKLAAISVDELRPSREKLAELLPELKVQQQKILGRLLADQTVEWLCWGLLRSKQLVKSLLSAGDGWKLRIANNPLGELGHKGNNMKVNMNKNRKLREVTKRGDKATDDQATEEAFAEFDYSSE